MILRTLSFSLVLLCGFSSSGCYVSWALRDSDFGQSRVIDETFKTVRSAQLAEDGTFALKVGATYDGKGGQGSAKYLIADASALAPLTACYAPILQVIRKTVLPTSPTAV